MSQVSIPQGTRDFSPAVMAQRQYIISHIVDVFKLYGFMPLETPAMENLSTLTGKYGDEGDKLLFRILKSGDFMKSVPEGETDSKILAGKIAERGLRYDLTVPLARHVVMNRNDIQFPFKRYQIQPVWRADRPQKGRYREFWQCDADVVGTHSLICEADFLRIYEQVFKSLGLLDYKVKINNRKILEGICEIAGVSEHFSPVCVAIDKLDKTGEQGLRQDLDKLGIDPRSSDKLFSLLIHKPFNQDTLSELKIQCSDNKLATTGIEELELILNLVNDSTESFELDLSLARGLDYYTGCIFEAVIPSAPQFGSISGGGRYDNLTGVFGMKDVSGVGISFGIDRIYDILLDKNLFPQSGAHFTDVLICPMDNQYLAYCNKTAEELRKNGFRTEVYPDGSKLKKQLDYANAKNIRFALIVGENEVNSESFTIKDMETGEQRLVPISSVVSHLS